MSVNNGTAEGQAYYGATERDQCTLCNGKLEVPYVCWQGVNKLFFCTRCCGELRDGLQADFIEVDAIRQLRELGRGWYHNHTFVRTIGAK